jgi:hypothetical protein
MLDGRDEGRVHPSGHVAADTPATQSVLITAGAEGSSRIG